MSSEHVKNAAVGALVAATLIGGVIAVAAVGDPGGGARPAPGPAGRARAAVALGAPAAPADLNALIADRERWLAEHPEDGESWAELGTAYAERGARQADWAALGRAERALGRSLDVLPAAEGNTEALTGLAVLANARQDFTAARGYAEQARKQRPRRWTVYPALIEAYTGLGAYKKAGSALEAMQKLYEGPQARGVAARLYRVRGWREDAASTAYDSAAGADGPAEKGAALLRLGDLAWERGEPAEALTAYDLSLRLAPGARDTLAARGRALAALERTEEALRDYQAALAGSPRPEHALEAGELYQSLGLGGDAESQYEKVRTAAARAAEHGGNQELVIGRWEADHGDPAEAAELLRAEWDGGRRSIEVADALAWALFRSGRAKEALPYARKATEEGMRSPLFFYHRGEIERALGRYGPARRFIGQALRINPYFSPLLVSGARDALEALGEPPPGGPRKVTGREGLLKPRLAPRRGAGTGSTGAGGTAGAAPGRTAAGAAGGR
ncbi:tetratricopeptide repeat protein [Streptomyces sp. CAU 1734]|uniref:tetratricopeptide repeat protein n=1 Tax=Streptomyces sp. CAU 1734 TaxID=3140360 RepID=UPI003260AE04